MNIDVEPNILLILIGAGFVLIGVSGKILIEKFSVSLNTLGTRLIISVLGLILLTIGIVGPQNILSESTEETTATSSPPQFIEQSQAWFNNIAGSYSGKFVYDGQTFPVWTQFNVSGESELSGIYQYEMNGGSFNGTLRQISSNKVGEVEFDYQEDNSAGKLKIQFSEDFNNFSGTWGDGHGTDLSNHWYGRRQSN